MRKKRVNVTEFSLSEFERAVLPFSSKEMGDDLVGFAKAAWPILMPGRELNWSWHLDYICELLILVKQRKLRRLIINVPPRTLKSTLVTIIFPVWTWITEPGHQFMTASYSLDLSTEHSMKRRQLLRSKWFRKSWGDRFQLSRSRNRIDYFTNNRGGHMISTSVGATTLGRGCDTAILDDPVSPNQALSDAERASANNWIGSVWMSRLNHPATGASILVMQRLHQLDPTGFLLRHEPHLWTHVRIPLEAEEDEEWIFPLSGRTVFRKAGEILLPERFKSDVVEEHRSRRLVYASQYQQNPAPLEGNIIKRQHVQFYGGINPLTGQADEKLPTSFDVTIISVDCAFKDLASSDFVAICVIGVKGSRRYVLNVLNAHLNAAATEAAIRQQRNLYGPINAVVIEDRANGPAIIQRLKLTVPGVIGVNPEGGKTARLFAAAAEWEAGDWFLDRNAAWTEPLIEQLTMFPNAANDDMADALSQAACWLLGRGIGPTVTISNAFTGEIWAQF